VNPVDPEHWKISPEDRREKATLKTYLLSFSLRSPQKRQEYPEYQNMTMLGYACGLQSSLYTKSIAFALKNYAAFVPSFLDLKS
jgi:hypothetical protein